MLLHFPPWALHGGSFLMGLIMGSFANVLIARLPAGKSIVHPGSQCPGCGAPIRFYDNVPLLSYAWLLGRCRRCKAVISPRYPVVEILGGTLFLAAELHSGFSAGLVIRDWPFLVILLAITFIDLDHRIIPDALSLGGLGLGLATGYFSRLTGWLGSIEGAALGFGVFYGLSWFYARVAKRQGLGGGDIKLLAMLGAFLGPMGVLTTIMVSSILGSVIGIAWGIGTRSRNLMTLAIPYGPFLVIGGMFYYFFHGLIWLRFMIPT